jgi:hypothetical protein
MNRPLCCEHESFCEYHYVVRAFWHLRSTVRDWSDRDSPILPLRIRLLPFSVLRMTLRFVLPFDATRHRLVSCRFL